MMSALMGRERGVGSKDDLAREVAGIRVVGKMREILRTAFMDGPIEGGKSGRQKKSGTRASAVGSGRMSPRSPRPA